MSPTFCRRNVAVATAALACLLAAPTVPQAQAAFLLGGGENYALLFQGGGNNTLQITNVTINGNVAVAGSGQATDSGPSTINGGIDFSAANTGQFSNNNASNVIAGGVHYNVGAVAGARTYVTSLSQQLMNSAGTAIAINGIQIVNATAGATFVINGQTVHVFDATSFNNNGTSDVLTINGGANDLVAFNLDGLGNIQFHGGIDFTGGIGADNVIFNVGGGDYTNFTGAASLDINNNGGAAGIARGIFLDPNGTISVTNAIVEGRVFGGDSHDFQYVSGAKITAPQGPVAVPVPPSIVLALGGMIPFGGAALLRLRRRPTAGTVA